MRQKAAMYNKRPKMYNKRQKKKIHTYSLFNKNDILDVYKRQEPNNELEGLTLVLWDNCPAVTIPPAVVDSFQSTEIPRPYCCMLSVSCASIFADTSKPVITNFIALFIVFFYFFIH